MGQDCVRKGKSMMIYAPRRDLRCTCTQHFCSQPYNFITLKFSETSKFHTRQNLASDEFLAFHCRILAGSQKYARISIRLWVSNAVI